MFERWSLRFPITLGVTMIILIVTLIVGWVLLTVFGAIRESENAALYWTLLSLGSIALTGVLTGVVLYLTLTVKAIDLTKRQSNFIDSVTHELKSPIASLKLYLQTLTRRNVSAQERHDFHRYMLDDIERLDSLINHLLDAGRIDKPRVDTEVSDVDLAKLLRDCAHSVCVRYRVPPETVALSVPTIHLHARHVDLDMLFRNLIDNAVKYAGKPPQVAVTASVETKYIVVRIVDNGRGIPAEYRRRIFGRFVRLGLELERETPGTGLGLYIVRTLVKRLRGKIQVQDVAKGTGTAFEVWIPKTENG